MKIRNRSLFPVARARTERRARTGRRGHPAKAGSWPKQRKNLGSCKLINTTYSTTCVRCNEIESRVVRRPSVRTPGRGGDPGYFRAFEGPCRAVGGGPRLFRISSLVVYTAVKLHGHRGECGWHVPARTWFPRVNLKFRADVPGEIARASMSPLPQVRSPPRKRPAENSRTFALCASRRTRAECVADFV